MPEDDNLALRFVSGKYKGGEFPLTDGREYQIGRQADLDMVLVEDMVSRRHAKIVTSNGEISIEDLNSTNGTFVNGQKVKRTVLNEGDRILVGTSLLRLVSTAGAALRTVEEARKDLSRRDRRPSASSQRMAGSLAEFPLPDLLQLLSTGKKTGKLRVEGPTSGGAIHFANGEILNAECDGMESKGTKALFRMITWTGGSFKLGAAEEGTERLIDTSTEGLLLDAMRELDEVMRIKDELPGEAEPLTLPSPLVAQLRDLPPEELDALQAALNAGTVGRFIDSQGSSDYESWKILMSLAERGYLKKR